MKIHIEHRQDVAIVRPVGRYSNGTLDFMLRDAVAAVIAAGARHVVLDLADVASIDSSGLGELVSAYATARNRGVSLLLVRPSEAVADVLASSRLRSVFIVHASVDTAIAAASQRSPGIEEARGRAT